jgi:hypothetical protein
VTRARRERDAAGRVALTGPPAVPEPHPHARIATLAAGTVLRRFYWPEPYDSTATGLRFNGPRARFDHQRRPGPFPAAADDPERGILYAAPSFECCVVECFGDDYVIEPDGAWFTVLETTRELRLLDIRKRGAMHAGTLAAINQDGARETTQDWSRYWYGHPGLAGVDGLLYAGAHNDDDAVALWERADGALEPAFDRPATDPAVLSELLVVAHDLGMTVLGRGR